MLVDSGWCVRAVEWATQLGWPVRVFGEVGSTQDEARRAARAGAPSRSVFVAEYQSAGRGRQGRPWVAPAGSCLTLSVLFRPAEATPLPLRYTMLASVALAQAIDTVAPRLRAEIKWPNDVMLGQRKAAGVLAEALWLGPRLTMIVGVGVNVNLGAEELRQASPTATSLAAEMDGEEVDRCGLFGALIERLDVLERLPLAELRGLWSARLWGIGQRLTVAGLDLEGAETGALVRVLGVEEDGALRVELPDGRVVRTVSAEIIL